MLNKRRTERQITDPAPNAPRLLVSAPHFESLWKIYAPHERIIHAGIIGTGKSNLWCWEAGAWVVAERDPERHGLNWQSLGDAPPSGGTGPPCRTCGQSIWVELGGGDAASAFHPNVDIRDVPGVDIALDLEHAALTFHDTHAEKIKAVHIFNHISKDSADRLVGECWRVLRPGGTLYVMLSDFEFVCQAYVYDIANRERWLGSIYDGEHGQYHLWGYTFESFSELLRRHGFTEIRHLGFYNRWEFKCQGTKP